MTKIPTSRLHLEAPTTFGTHVSIADRSVSPVQMPAATPTASLSDPKKCPPSVIVISDSESDGKNDSKSDGKDDCKSDSDSDSEIEVSHPVKIEKKYDCFELTDDENGELSVKQTYDAATDTCFHEPTMPYIPNQAKASRVTFLSHSKTRTQTKLGMSGSAHDSDSGPPSQGSRQGGSKSKRLHSASPSKPTTKTASGAVRCSKKAKKL